jgi:hypothetical protein
MKSVWRKVLAARYIYHSKQGEEKPGRFSGVAWPYRVPKSEKEYIERGRALWFIR